ncbi:serine/threonine kinase [Nitzschia inconspicua]|uniref:Serine/threonine kinase n=1 Tax=Nitzschia inconspicua TaxID=303405 RepID=A0A9K3LPC2_9STRA|nr:serine/threonine kinase [Nitzschia inconspicua]
MNFGPLSKSSMASKRFPYAVLAVAATSAIGWTASQEDKASAISHTSGDESVSAVNQAHDNNRPPLNSQPKATAQIINHHLPAMASIEFLSTTQRRCLCDAIHDNSPPSPTSPSSPWSSLRDAFLPRRGTVEKLEQLKTQGTAADKYEWDKDHPVGQGAYSRVFRATVKDAPDEVVALKQISKQYTNDQSFQQEMEAMLHVQESGGHPHLISLHEHFETDDSFILVLDFIQGGELFDHLIENGAYSEMDASRITREVASALNFLHGIGIVHADLKPENILLSTTRRGDSVTKVADFGTAVFVETNSRDDNKRDDDGRIKSRTSIQQVYGAPTPAYCPPGSIQRTEPIQPATDMWALGVIVFIMLTGCHPYDVSGKATDEEIEANIKNKWYAIPIHNRKVAGHLSLSAKDLIIKLMDRNPKKRMTAYEMLQHPWVRGETATTAIIAGSDKRLSDYRGFKSKLQAKFFENAIKWSDKEGSNGSARKLSLIERAFRSFDADERGFLSTKDFMDDDGKDVQDIEEGGGPAINMTDFKSLLSENVENKYFPSGHVVYREGSTGNSMYFIESGTVEVITDGTRALRTGGDFFGEGALLSADKTRSATVKCQTPVHALEISREYFEKYISYSETGLYLILKEKDKIRKRNRAKTILRMQKDLKTVAIPRRGHVFKNGDEGNSLFIMESGQVDVEIKGKTIFSCFPGNIIGEYSVLTGNRRNCDAKCVSKEGCVVQELPGHHFRKLLETSPSIRESLRELQMRREFKKAVVNRTRKEFPYENPEKAFEAADLEQVGQLDKESIAKLMRELNPEYTDEEIDEVVQSLDLTDSGVITFASMKKALIGDKQASASM